MRYDTIHLNVFNSLTTLVLFLWYFSMYLEIFWYLQKIGDGENIDEDSMESDIIASSGQPTFQNFLLQFLDTKAPVIGRHIYTDIKV